jgi:hypothetical protein
MAAMRSFDVILDEFNVDYLHLGNKMMMMMIIIIIKKTQKVFMGNIITCSMNCNHRTAAELYTQETSFASDI